MRVPSFLLLLPVALFLGGCASDSGTADNRQMEDYQTTPHAGGATSMGGGPLGAAGALAISAAQAVVDPQAFDEPPPAKTYPPDPAQ